MGTLQVENGASEPLGWLDICPLGEPCDVWVFSGGLQPGEVLVQPEPVGQYLLTAWNEAYALCEVESVWVASRETTRWTVTALERCL